MSFEGDALFYTDQHLVNGENQAGSLSGPMNPQQFELGENKFMHFIRSHQENGMFKYREQMKNNALRGNYYLRVEMRDIQAFDEDLYVKFREMPVDFIRVFEKATETIYRNDIYD
jgi:DNA replicative helicase MCM subunit Mcm2 (Cdc46/Mcm family)